jgi:hypothetical protein
MLHGIALQKPIILKLLVSHHPENVGDPCSKAVRKYLVSHFLILLFISLTTQEWIYTQMHSIDTSKKMCNQSDDELHIFKSISIMER